MRFLRAVRLDASDDQVYPAAARAGEWVVPGGFAFWNADPVRLDTQHGAAFRHGLLGTESFGWTTLARVDELTDQALHALIERIAEHLLAHYGAPDIWAARAAAHEEAEFAMSLCDRPGDTLIAVQRELSAEGIVENFRTLQAPSAADHHGVRLWGAAEG